VTQGKEHDPDGDYVRRWVPELRHIAGAAVHEPWKVGGGGLQSEASSYPPPIVDHATERKEALDRYAAVRSR
jgi:deoxyribodipyrimidine photo-lyase